MWLQARGRYASSLQFVTYQTLDMDMDLDPGTRLFALSSLHPVPSRTARRDEAEGETRRGRATRFDTLW